MKRGLTLLLASLVLAVSLTACGGDTRDKQGEDGVLGNPSGASNGGGSTQDSGSAGGGNGSAGSDVRDGMDDLENGMDDMLQDAGDAMDDMMDGLAGDTAGNGAGNGSGTQGTPQSGRGPAWQGNLHKPNFPGSAGGSL